MTSDDIADRLVSWAVSEPALRALWVEGSVPRDVRRPYEAPTFHVAVDEPDFAAMVDGMGPTLDRLVGGKVLSVADVPRFAKELGVEVEGRGLRLVIERTSMLAKRPRAHVATLFDRTGHLAHVLDYSLRSAT